MDKEQAGQGRSESRENGARCAVLSVRGCRPGRPPTRRRPGRRYGGRQGLREWVHPPLRSENHPGYERLRTLCASLYRVLLRYRRERPTAIVHAKGPEQCPHTTTARGPGALPAALLGVGPPVTHRRHRPRSRLVRSLSLHPHPERGLQRARPWSGTSPELSGPGGTPRRSQPS